MENIYALIPNINHSKFSAISKLKIADTLPFSRVLSNEMMKKV
jgi:hypothetical protein